MNRCMCAIPLKNCYFAFAYYEDNETMFFFVCFFSVFLPCKHRQLSVLSVRCIVWEELANEVKNLTESTPNN